MAGSVREPSRTSGVLRSLPVEGDPLVAAAGAAPAVRAHRAVAHGEAGVGDGRAARPAATARPPTARPARRGCRRTRRAASARSARAPARPGCRRPRRPRRAPARDARAAAALDLDQPLLGQRQRHVGQQAEGAAAAERHGPPAGEPERGHHQALAGGAVEARERGPGQLDVRPPGTAVGHLAHRQPGCSPGAPVSSARRRGMNPPAVTATGVEPRPHLAEGRHRLQPDVTTGLMPQRRHQRARRAEAGRTRRGGCGRCWRWRRPRRRGRPAATPRPRPPPRPAPAPRPTAAPARASTATSASSSTDVTRPAVADEVGEQRGVVAGAGPDLEHAVAGADARASRASGHDRRLRRRRRRAARHRVPPGDDGVVAVHVVEPVALGVGRPGTARGAPRRTRRPPGSSRRCPASRRWRDEVASQGGAGRIGHRGDRTSGAGGTLPARAHRPGGTVRPCRPRS